MQLQRLLSLGTSSNDHSQNHYQYEENNDATIDNSSNSSNNNNRNWILLQEYCSNIITFIYQYNVLQILLLCTLIAITIFRKEMSCNHCYHHETKSKRTTKKRKQQQPQQQQTRNSNRKPRRSRNEQQQSLVDDHRTILSSSSMDITTSTSPLEDTEDEVDEEEEEVEYYDIDDDTDNGWDNQQTELLLEEAGCYGSGTYNIMIRTIQIIQHRSLVVLRYYCNNKNHPSSFVTTILYYITNVIVSWWNIAASSHTDNDDGHCAIDDILSGAEHWSIIQPTTTNKQQSQLQQQLPSNIIIRTSSKSSLSLLRNKQEHVYHHQDNTQGIFPEASNLPNDTLVHILLYLHPKDIISFASTCRTSTKITNTIFVQQEYPDKDDDNDNDEPSTIRTRRRQAKRSTHLSHTLWKSLWYRDYGWLVVHWSIGKEALQRSLRVVASTAATDTSFNTDLQHPTTQHLTSIDDIVFTPTFYFRFGLSYMNYIIAGHCNRQRCMIGLNGHIYDITNFLDDHPGSSETVLVHSGCDASAMFETMRHTLAARLMAQYEFCIVVNMSLLSRSGMEDKTSQVGAHPTNNFLWNATTNIAKITATTTTSSVDMKGHTTNDHPCCCIPTTVVESPTVSHRCYGNRSMPSTLASIYKNYMEEQDTYQQKAMLLTRFWFVGSRTDVHSSNVVGDVHTYYDPILQRWRAWYMNSNFESVFIDF